MKTEFKNIKKQFQKQWPELKWTMPTDSEYWLPTKQELLDFIDNNKSDIPYMKDIYECEEFSLGLMVDLRRWRARKKMNEKKIYLNWAVGLALTIKHTLTGEKIHYQNIALTSDEGIILIEPQSNTITDINRIKELHFILM